MRRSASVSVVVIVATVLIGSGVPSDAGLATTGSVLAGGVLVSSSLFAWSEYRSAQRRYEADLEEYARRTAAGAQDVKAPAASRGSAAGATRAAA